MWVEVAKSAKVARSTIARLKNELPACPVLYLLIKTHKFSSDNDVASNDPTTFKVRPIISGVGGPTDRIAWFLNIIVSQVLRFIPAHLSNTTMFLDHLRCAKIDEDCIMESFDVNSLYTNVSNDSAMQAVCELLTDNEKEINLYGFSIGQVMTLIKECLSCTIFRWSGNYYEQLRGLAMGQRLAPTLAIAFMSRIEKPVLELQPLLYRRYIDDCFIICSTQAAMDRCFQLLNEQSDLIKFTRETPEGGWLPFLNVQVHLARGVQATKWYRKSSSKNILVHYLSAHPKRMKQSVIRNMFRTAAKVSSGVEEKEQSLKLAREVAESNGYGKEEFSRKHSKRFYEQTALSPFADKIPFCVPYVSDEVTRVIRQCLRRAQLSDSVSLVEIPPNNLKRMLVRNRMYDRLCTTQDCKICPNGKVGDCMVAGVVYSIKCEQCNDEYIGETARPLCLRIKEHLDGKAKQRKSSVLGNHREARHSGADFEVSVSIMAQESNTAARKSLEAFLINIRTPKMNRKDECLAITNELIPYLELIS